MKIAIFVEAYLSQATAAAAHSSILASGLLKLGHDVLIVTSDTEADECYTQDNIVFCPAKASLNCCGQTAKSAKLPGLNPFVDKFRPNIIHVQTFTEIGLAGQKYAQKHDLPLVCTLHDLHDVCNGFEVNKAIDLLSKMQSQTIFKKIIGSADLILSASKKNTAIAQSLIPCKVKNIPLCIDTELFRYISGEDEAKDSMRTRLRLNNGKVGFVFTGRLCEENQVETLLELWSKSFSIKDNLQLIIVGSGRDQALLKKQTKLFGITDNVTFTGNLTRDDLSLCYSVCRAFVSATGSATMKSSPIEAIASGLPVILPKNCANAEILSQAVNGFVYKDDKEFSELVKKLATLNSESDIQLKKLVSKTATALTDVNQAKSMEECYLLTQKQHKEHIVPQ